MKRISAFLIAPLAIFSNACEKHPASELPPEHKFGEHAHGDSHASEARGTESSQGHADPSKPQAEPHVAEHGPDAVKEPQKYDGGKPAAAHAESKADEAPKFFPEKN